MGQRPSSGERAMILPPDPHESTQVYSFVQGTFITEHLLSECISTGSEWLHVTLWLVNKPAGVWGLSVFCYSSCHISKCKMEKLLCNNVLVVSVNFPDDQIIQMFTLAWAGGALSQPPVVSHCWKSPAATFTPQVSMPNCNYVCTILTINMGDWFQRWKQY